MWRIIKYFLFLSSLMPLSFGNALEISDKFLEILPNEVEKVHSQDVNDLIEVFNKLTFIPMDSDYPDVGFRYDLPKEDYSFLIDRILNTKSPKLKQEEYYSELSRICVIIKKFKMAEKAVLLAYYIDTKSQYAQQNIFNTLKFLKVKELASYFVPFLNCSDIRIKLEAKRILIGLEATEVIPVLLEDLKSDNDGSRYEALLGLGIVGNADVAPHVAKLLKDPQKDLRYWALDTLFKINSVKEYVPEIWELFDNGDEAVRKARPIAILVSCGDEKALNLASDWLTGKVSYEYITSLKDELINARSREIIPYLVKALQSSELFGGVIYKNNGIRRDIVSLLGKFKAYESIPVLIEYVKSKDESLRNEAVSVLGNLRAKEAVDEILPLLRKSKGNDIFSTSYAAVALAKIGDRRVWPNLIEFVDDVNQHYRSEIIIELNASLDPILWQKIHNIQFKGLHMQPIDITIKEFAKQSGLKIILNLEQDKNIGDYPKANTYVNDITLFFGLQRILVALCGDKTPASRNPYTFLFIKDEIHLLPIPEAIKYLKDYMKQNAIDLKN